MSEGNTHHEHGHPADNPHGEARVHHKALHGHQHGGDHDHDHKPRNSLLGVVKKLALIHSHSHSHASYGERETSARGIWAIKVSLVLLGITAAFQVLVVAISGSVALFADTIHNFTDALTGLPLWLAFWMSRRPASRRFTHGYGRMEDLAGLIIVVVIVSSAVVAGYESYRRILDPQDLDNIEWVMLAAVIGFIGNEAVASLRVRVGKEIGSATLVADGQHARIDGLTSLAVLVGALGVLAGAPIADPLIGAVITFAILFIAKDAAMMIWHRLMDAVEPELLRELEHAAEHAIEGTSSVYKVSDLRVRWLGHVLHAELNLTVDEDLSTKLSHQRAEEVKHALFHAAPQLAHVIVHVEPDGHSGADPHELTAHHRPPRPSCSS